MLSAEFGVHDIGGGDEDGVGAGGLEEGEVGLEGAGVFGEVFVGGELGGIDEDGGQDLSRGRGMHPWARA